MIQDRPSLPAMSPMPAALLALSVIVCMGTMAQAGSIQSLAAQSRSQALNERENLGQLLAAITESTRKQNHKPAAQVGGDGWVLPRTFACANAWTTTQAPVADPLPPMRSALLNLPPPIA